VSIHRRPLHALAFFVATMAGALAARADPTEECIAANEKAIELRKAGKLLDARAETAKCALDACGADIRRVCAQRAEDINAVLPSVVFDVKDDQGSDIAGVRVMKDGRALENATISAVPLDPGEHRFVVEAPGRPPIERTIILREGERLRRERVLVTSGKPPDVVTPAPAAPSTPAPRPPAADDRSSGSTMRIVGLGVAGVGVVGLVVGSVFGISAAGKWSDAKTQCTSGGRVGCDANDPAQETRRSAESAATLSTVFLVTGGVLVVGGAVLYFTAPNGSTTASVRLSPVMGPRSAGLGLSGSF
jgi:hypothetical protein